jgi:hypothetical protein
MHASKALLIAIVDIILATTAVHGVVTNRWNGGDVAPVLPEIPKQFGEWVGEDQRTTIDEPGIAYLSRRYTSATNGRVIVISLSLGHPGLTAIHTPEYCYTGSGYEMNGSTSHFEMPSLDAEFWTTCFQKPGGADALRIYWGWSANGQWRAPNHPRLSFLGKPSLCKLYIVAAGAGATAAGQDKQLDDFMTRFIGQLNGAMFPTSNGTLRGSPTPPTQAEAVGT